MNATAALKTAALGLFTIMVLASVTQVRSQTAEAISYSHEELLKARRILPNVTYWSGSTYNHKLYEARRILPNVTYWSGQTYDQELHEARRIQHNVTYWSGSTYDHKLYEARRILPDVTYWSGDYNTQESASPVQSSR